MRSFKVMNNRIFLQHRQAFIITNKIASLDLWEMLYLLICIHTIDDTTGCAMSCPMCQMAWHLNCDALPCTYTILWGVDTSCRPSVSLAHHEHMWVMCSKYLELWKGLFKFEVRCAKKYLMLYMGHLKLPSVPVDGQITDPDIHDLLDYPCDVVRIPIHSGEIVHCDIMTCDIGMVINGWRSPDVSLKPLAKCTCRLSYLYITPFFSVMFVLSFGANRRLLMVLLPLKWTFA